MTSLARKAHGLEVDIRAFTGARAIRIMDGGSSEIEEHRHDWPILSIYVMGELTKVSEHGRTQIASASTVLHAAGEYHANLVGKHGLEQIDVQFDPAWLGRQRDLRFDGIRCWIGGPVAAAGRALAARWTSAVAEERELVRATQGFLQFALTSTRVNRPTWLERITDRLNANPRLTASDLAAEAGCSPAWLAQAFRATMGEGVAEVSRRRRVERAALLLRESALPTAEIALAAGFCDQSHMNRAFRALLGRTPVQVRRERAFL